MLSATLTLDDASGDAVVYALQKYTADGSVRLDSASTLAEPRSIRIAHTQSGKGQQTVYRHLVGASLSKYDSNGAPVLATVNVTLNQPANTAITTEEVIDLFANLVDLLCDGGFGDSGMTGTTTITDILRGGS